MFDLAQDQGASLVFSHAGHPMSPLLGSLFLGLSKEALRKKLGIVFYDYIIERNLSSPQVISQEFAYHYHSDDLDTIDTINHRHYIIQVLYRLTARHMALNPHSSDTVAMCSKIIDQKYTVIHSRSLEGLVDDWLEYANEELGVDIRASIDFPSSLITSILRPLALTKNKILMITDWQNHEVIRRLSSDPIIGPNFKVVSEEQAGVASDLMLAILSDCFIGNPVSTFSQYIVQVRYALGIKNSYLFVRKNRDHAWETFCEDELCFYNWIKYWTGLDQREKEDSLFRAKIYFKSLYRKMIRSLRRGMNQVLQNMSTFWHRSYINGPSSEWTVIAYLIFSFICIATGICFFWWWVIDYW